MVEVLGSDSFPDLVRVGMAVAPAVIGVVGTVAVYRLRKGVRRQSLRKALYTEVSSMRWIKETDLSELKRGIKAGDMPPHTFVPTQVYHAEIENLGLLSNSERTAVISYYQSAQVAQDQLQRMVDGGDDQTVRNVFADRTLDRLEHDQEDAEGILESHLTLRKRVGRMVPKPGFSVRSLLTSDVGLSGVGFTPLVKRFTMPRLTITLTEEQAEKVAELSSDDGPYESKSEAVRNLIQAGERVGDLEEKVERLDREKRIILEQREENQELVRYAETERAYREAGLPTRLRWFLFGRQD